MKTEMKELCGKIHLRSGQKTRLKKPKEKLEVRNIKIKRFPICFFFIHSTQFIQHLMSTIMSQDMGMQGGET